MEEHVTRQFVRIAATVLSTVVLLGMLPGLVSADNSPVLAAPTALAMARAGTSASVIQGGWINSGKFDAHFQVQVSGAPLTPQVEVESEGVAFTGQAGFSGPILASSGAASVTVAGLVNGKTYHWQARVVDANGAASQWIPFSTPGAGFDVGVDRSPPTRPDFSSVTNPNPNHWYSVRAPIVQWIARDSLSGIRGYTFRLLRSPHVIKAGPVTPATGARLSNLSDGVWWAAVRALDRAGNWSATATFRLMLDREAPRIWWQSGKHLQFNPLRGPVRVQLKVSKDSNLKLSLWRVGARQPTATYFFSSLRAGQTVSIVWYGKDSRGKLAPKGFYYFAADVVDHANNVTHVNLGGIALNPEMAVRTPSGVQVYPDGGKRIVVSLGQQTLYAYDGMKQVLRTFVTTGNPNLPTPPGSYTIMAKYSPFQFISPWPPGSPYWYPPSWSSYAMLFRDGGYFLHDAPWRSAFGPGTNGPGQPGTNYGGTHGCVNIPPSPMLFLWNFATIGTPVDVVP